MARSCVGGASFDEDEVDVEDDECKSVANSACVVNVPSPSTTAT